MVKCIFVRSVLVVEAWGIYEMDNLSLYLSCMDGDFAGAFSSKPGQFDASCECSTTYRSSVRDQHLEVALQSMLLRTMISQTQLSRQLR